MNFLVTTKSISAATGAMSGCWTVEKKTGGGSSGVSGAVVTLSIAVLFALFPQPLRGQLEGYSEIVEKSEALESIASEHRSAVRQRERLSAIYGDPYFGARAETRRLEKLIAETGQRMQLAKAEVDLAVASYERRHAHLRRLADLAIAKHKEISAATGGHPEMKARVLRTIEEQLPFLLQYNVDGMGQALSAVERLLQAGRPDKEIGKAVSNAIDDPNLKYVFDLAWGEAASLMKSPSRLPGAAGPALAGYSRYASKLGAVGRVIAGLKLLNVSKDRLGDPNLERLKLLSDLGSDIGGGYFPPMAVLGAIHSMQIGAIVELFERGVEPALVERNLQFLADTAQRDVLVNDWKGPHPNVLFGRLVHSSISGLADSYTVSARVSGSWTVCQAGRLSGDAWVGLINLPKLKKDRDGDSFEERVNDGYDGGRYVYLRKKVEGTFSFTAPSVPGEYAIRIFASDSGGEMICDERFTVTASSSTGKLGGSWKGSGIWVGPTHNVVHPGPIYLPVKPSPKPSRGGD